MESPNATFSSTIGFWTQYRANRAIVNRMRSTYVVWGFFIGVPLLVIVVMLCLGQDLSASGTSGLPAWAMLSGGPLFVLVFMPLLQLLTISSMRRRSPTAGKVQTYTVTPDGYTVRGSLFDSALKWEAFVKAVETKEFFLFYLSARWAHFIPKATATEADLQTIRAILREKLGTKAKLLQA
jgi:YcxB-like protein